MNGKLHREHSKVSTSPYSNNRSWNEWVIKRVFRIRRGQSKRWLAQQYLLRTMYKIYELEERW